MYQGGNLISQISKLTGRKINELLRASGITEINGAQGTILYALWSRSGLTIHEIAAITGLARTTLSSMLERMRQADLVKIEENPQDARSKVIHLTKKSERLRHIYERISRDMTDCYYRDFTETEIRQFESMLERVLDNIEHYEVNETWTEKNQKK